jgi:hypothetical protein
MQILVAINESPSYTPFQYLTGVLKNAGNLVDIVKYPSTKKYGLMERAYFKLERIYLRYSGYKPDQPFEPYQDLFDPLVFVDEIGERYQYDLVINFCDSQPKELERVSSQRHWHVSNYDDPNRCGIDTAAYIIKNESITPLYIWEKPGNKLIYFSETLGTFPSITRTDFNLLCKAVNIVIRIISSGRAKQNSSKSVQKKYTTLNAGITSICIHILRFLFVKIRHYFFVEQYNLLIGAVPDDVAPSLNLLKKIEPPKDRFWADPFIVECEGLNYLFVEEMIFTKDRGVIRCLTLKDVHQIEIGPVALEMPYHLSFPSVFRFQDKFFMIPETLENKSIELFECVEFPYKWRKRKTIFDNILAVDSFVMFRDNKWWLFTNVAPGPGCNSSDELHIFFTDNPINGKWVSHPLNPVVEGSGFSRNAGRIFEHKGKLYRPSQICAKRYGAGVNINEVSLLTESEYKETCIYRIIPGRNDETISAHTLNRGTKHIVMDGVKWARKT